MINGAALGYLLSVRGKSHATWWLIARTAAAAVYWAASSLSLSSTELPEWVAEVVIDSALLAAGVALAQFAHRFLETPYPREARATLAGPRCGWPGTRSRLST